MTDTEPQIILTAHELSRIYKVKHGIFRAPQSVMALNDASFSLKKGSTLAIVGESGCGKTTLARILAMIDTPTSGSLTVCDIDTGNANAHQRRKLRTAVQMVFQNPHTSLNPRKTIKQTLNEPLVINTPLSAKERGDKIFSILELVGLRREHVDRYPHMFSGGQQQRIAIARAVILNPLIVIADEPVSALDVSIQAQIINLFMDLQEDLGTSYIFISHNLSVVRHMADDMIVMYLGRIVEMGPKSLVYENPLHPYTQALIAATPQIHHHQKTMKSLKGELPSPLNIPKGCAFHTRCPFATDRCRAEFPELRPIQNRWAACHYAEQFISKPS